MTRSIDPWVAKHDDQAIPDRVKLRVAQKAEDCCQKCRRKIGGALRAEFDHTVPLILGGKHAESNLQLLCHECHGSKTKLDVKLKAKSNRVRLRHLGLKKPKGRPMPGSRRSKWKKKVNGEVVERE